MTDSTANPKQSGIKKSSSKSVQIPMTLIQHVLSLKLTGTQYALWLYLWTYDPYGDRWVNIPSPAEIANYLEVDPRTVERAARRLIDCELFDFQIDQWKCRNTTVSVKARDPLTGRVVRNQTKRSRCGQKDPNADKKIQMPLIGSKDPADQLEPLSDEDANSLHTLHTNPYSLMNEEERKKEFLEENSQFFLPSGEVLPAYREWLLNRASRLPQYPALIERWIESQSRVKANQKDFLKYSEARETTSVPLPAPSHFQIETACLAAIRHGNREFAQYKLQELWDNGWIDLLKELCETNQEWGFVITSNGVEDVQ